ncbi:uncharacterized protein BYT42DRAFT_612701 [Radiomyces spectabilis]|uniref:uncharacterized protein n=1 Tax=Radiomyces spectabilis TaxID=64574 RepID=UPI002220AB73|nr:uncharacterized protein BYT42DRAFT_612701 [Radiomyces spectabilis]KAI8385052.1 hypothetical protein BYT42DRAFT_612701 [Radiomyces spectabilis]
MQKQLQQPAAVQQQQQHEGSNRRSHWLQFTKALAPRNMEEPSPRQHGTPLFQQQNDVQESSASFTEKKKKKSAHVQLLEEQIEHMHAETQRLKESEEQLRQYSQEMERKLRTMEQQYQVMSKDLQEHYRAIRVTDDDYATIKQQLSALLTKVESFPFGIKQEFSADKNIVVSVFGSRWPRLSKYIEGRLCRSDQSIDYSVVAFLVQKLIMEELAACIFNAPIHMASEVNNDFARITTWLTQYHVKGFGRKLRQQLCKVIATMYADTNYHSSPQYRKILECRDFLIKSVVDIISKIYQTANRSELEKKLGKLVDEATKLSLAMHGQDNPVIIRIITEGRDVLDPEYMTEQRGSSNESDIVQLVISPAFVYHDDAGYEMCLCRAKVICHENIQ